MSANYRVEGKTAYIKSGEWRGVTYIYQENRLMMIHQNAVAYESDENAKQHAINFGMAVLRALPEEVSLHNAHFSAIGNRGDIGQL